MKKEFTNQLIHQTSAYLLQHAHNPVNWFPWSDEALSKAKQEDKPLLVSIGYSACHWCHVMEKESFEDEETAALMNRYFINIKIDREERPDLDHIYMDAVQTITGSGGWPLNVFLTPDLKPFYGGTYFPPVAAFNRNSWKEVLTAVANTYQTKKNEINAQAQNLIEHILHLNAFKNDNANDAITKVALETITKHLLTVADKEHGGFGNAPKFPQTFSILYLLRHYYFFSDEAALKQATSSLDNMMMGGIYDQLGGGFARYSTDRQWKVPHFEKMLYDNALLIETFTEAYQLTAKKQYAQVVEETIQFIKRELTSPAGGFYSALDADSEGIEGKYYVWTKLEITELLKDDSEVFCSVYNITTDGNWEGSNILWMPEPTETIADVYNLNDNELQSLLKKSRQILFEKRQKRVRPLLDTKIILAWNALMIKSLCKAYAAFGNEVYLSMAENAIAFIQEHMQGANNIFYHSWNTTLNKQEAFLDDYAALVQAYIHLSQVKPDAEYLLKAKQLCERVTEGFDDEEGIHFYFTKVNQPDIIIRKKEMYDGATPSGNALMAENFLYLSIFFDDASLKQRAEKMALAIKSLVEKYPLSFGYWALYFQAFIKGFKEIVITGSNHKNLLRDILKQYIPVKVIQSSAQESNYWPLLRQKIFSEKTYIYLCENYSCLKPIETTEDFINLINQNISYKKF